MAYNYEGKLVTNDTLKDPLCLNNYKERYNSGKKLIYNWNYKNLNKILIDKELNIYGINDNGKPFQKGKFDISRIRNK